MTVMPIWRLSPVDLTDPNWQASSHRAATLVRAVDEEEARALAQEAFGVKTRFAPGVGVIAPPWLRAELVGVERVRDAPYDSEGPSEVLEPSFAQDLEGQPRQKR